MKKISILSILTLLVFSISMAASTLSGSWRGVLAIGQYKMPIVFNFAGDGESLKCTVDSPSQGVKGLPANILYISSDSISVSCESVGATYSGRIAGNEITGIFRQMGVALPLTLSPEDSAVEHRPQTPKAPFPYTVIDTVFTSVDGTTLAGTLTLPILTGVAKAPAVVMITGSGAQNRDEEILEHKPFAVIADYLARNGVASFRYDDRGTAASRGDFKTSTTYTFKDDAASATNFVHTFPMIGKVGALGHSEGGTIAFMLAGEGKCDFVISLAGMAVSGKELEMEQNKQALAGAKISDAERENSLKLVDLYFDDIIAGKSDIDVDRIVKDNNLAVPDAIVASIKQSSRNRIPWFDTFLTIVPAESLAKIKCPLLAINGDKDTQVSASSNLEVIKENVPQADVRLMPGLNHLMQHAVTGAVSEYYDITETISPEVLDIILAFSKAQ